MSLLKLPGSLVLIISHAITSVGSRPITDRPSCYCYTNLKSCRLHVDKLTKKQVCSFSSEELSRGGGPWTDGLRESISSSLYFTHYITFYFKLQHICSAIYSGYLHSLLLEMAGVNTTCAGWLLISESVTISAAACRKLYRLLG